MLQPLLVSTSAIHLASETVRSIMKIDDIVSKCFMFTELGDLKALFISH